MLRAIQQNPMIGLLLIPVFLISITFHEFSHAYISNKLGDPTPREMGRLTLNPLKHLDLFGTILIFIAGFGWAKPVPINPLYYKDKKKGTVLVSVVGPLSNLLLAFLFSFPYYILKSSEINTSTEALYILCQLFVILNINLAILNLIPIPPLDGSKILGSLLPEDKYFLILKYERQIGIVFILLIIFTDILGTIIGSIADPILKSFLYLVALILN